jgi:colanic acid biosynthesis glycosyl transferase WcaI
MTGILCIIRTLEDRENLEGTQQSPQWPPAGASLDMGQTLCGGMPFGALPVNDTSIGNGSALPLGIAGKRVLVVGINYWPEPTGIAPYTTGMAEYLADHGAKVTVLTGVPHYPQWRVPASYRRRLLTRERRRGVDVLRLWHMVPGEMTAFRRTGYELTFLAHAVLRGLRERPDLVLASTPALSGAIAAATVSRRVGSPLTIVVQDLTALATQQTGIKGGARVTAAGARLEGAALRAATTVAVVSDSFIPAVRAYGVAESRIALLRNWTHITPAKMTRDEARARLGWPIDEFLAVHTGNIGLKQDLGNLVEAARLMPRSSVLAVVVGDGSQRQSLEDQARGLRNVRFARLFDDELYPVVLAAADILLVNERPSVGEMSLPSKLTSYLAAGRPIVAAVSDGGAAQQELLRTGGAACTIPPGDPAGLAASLAALALDSGQRDAMGAAGRAYAVRNLGSERSLGELMTLLLRSQQAYNYA